MGNFKELKVWQKSRLLAIAVYQETSAFPRVEMFGLTQQMRRAAISIISNIAEGRGRYTDAEYRSFLVFARGSASELEAQIIISTDLGYLDAAMSERLRSNTNEVLRMLNAMIRYLHA
jgi:four helix bundle protein